MLVLLLAEVALETQAQNARLGANDLLTLAIVRVSEPNEKQKTTKKTLSTTHATLHYRQKCISPSKLAPPPAALLRAGVSLPLHQPSTVPPRHPDRHSDTPLSGKQRSSPALSKPQRHGVRHTNTRYTHRQQTTECRRFYCCV